VGNGVSFQEEKIMATHVPVTEIEAFRRFLDERIDNGTTDATLDHWVAEFRAFQKELADFRHKLAISEAQAERGEAEVIDVDALMQRVERRLNENNARK
jgi:hypothetical protein